jgi:folate-dependent phosphoribosylglycinamide formyltransferase PurN
MHEVKAVVLASPGAANYAVCHQVESLFPGCRFIFEQPESRWVFLKRRIKKLGLFPVVGQFAFQVLVVPVLLQTSAARIKQIQSEYGLRTETVDQARITEVPSVNAAQTIEAVQSIHPDVIVLAGTRILSKMFLQSVGCPVINIHAGITPLYRGVHGAYWALAEHRPELCGVTVHRVDAGIDTGEVLAQACIRPGPEDNFVTYPWMQLGEGLRLLKELLPKIILGDATGRKPMVLESRLRSHPTIWDYLSNRISGIR